MLSLFREHVVRNRELSDLIFILILILNYFETIIVEWFVMRLFRLYQLLFLAAAVILRWQTAYWCWKCWGIREEGFDIFWDNCRDVLDSYKLSAYTTRSWTAVESGTFRKTFKRVVPIPAYRRCLDFLNEMSYGAAEQIRELCVFRTGPDVHFVVVHHSLSHPYSNCLICPLGQSITN
jgi:hypothetical protein